MTELHPKAVASHVSISGANCSCPDVRKWDASALCSAQFK